MHEPRMSEQFNQSPTKVKSTYVLSIVGCVLLTSALIGCKSQQQRFVPIGDGLLALDTKTGRRCLTVLPSEVSGAKDPSNGPYCYDLYLDSR
jgi:hypothetical protein